MKRNTPIRFSFILLIPLLLLSTWTAAGQTPEPAFRPLEIGFHLGRGDAQHMEAARAAGGGFVVVVFSWADIEPEPNYLYWEQPDAALRAAEFYGLELIARLDQPPAWAADSGDPSPWNLAAYANFTRRVAERYGSRLAGVILWNEPNLSLEWNDQSPDATAYVAMLKAAYPAVKAAAPDLPVLLGGLASTEGEGDWAINDLDYLQALYAAGGAPYFDVLTAHPYGFGRPPDDPPGQYRPNFRRLELYREIMAANDDDHKPVWVTEMGWLSRTDNWKHEWQVVTPAVQANYILGAIAYARQFYPWLERLGFWELNAAGDAYGFGIWQGPGQTSPAYEALVAACPTLNQQCRSDPASRKEADSGAPVPILAPDVIIRLGDRPTLYPHWVHLYQGGGQASLAWQGEFFLTHDQAGGAYDLLLETMQVGQAGDRLRLNGLELASLLARPRPNPTSAWVTQRFSVPPDLLGPGPNSLSLAVGPRNPARQYVTGRWENMQFRHARLIPAAGQPAPLWTDWQPLPSPSGWSETNRLRPGLANDLWLTGARAGELWQGRSASDSEAGNSLVLENQAGNRPNLLFNDILPTPQGELAATGRGLFWRPASSLSNRAGNSDQLGDTIRLWQPITGPPADYAAVLSQAHNRFYAGFERAGLWVAPSPTGPWQRTGLTAAGVVDLAAITVETSQHLYAITDQGELWLLTGRDQAWQPRSMPGLSADALADLNESPGDKLWPRLLPATGGRLLLRRQDRLWQADPQAETGWSPFGPAHLAGKLLSGLDCCNPGALVGTNKAGLWQLAPGGEWQRLDNGYFEATDITTLLRAGDRLYAAGELGLFQSEEGQTWQKASGLPAVVSDLVVDPAEPARWLAATPAGLYRSQDRGQSWQPVSPPWTIWDMAFGPSGRLFLGRSNGLAWTDKVGAALIPWRSAQGMERVYFLSVNPHPTESQTVWSGAWGNNIGASQDGGESVAPVHNGLETLSGLDLVWHPTPGQVTLATLEGLYRTDDSGQSWFRLPGPLARQTVYSLLQTEDGKLWAGAADGLWFSQDYGAAWGLAETFPRASVLRLGQLAAPSETGRWLWAGTEAAGLWLSPDQGQTWHLAGLPRRTVYNVFADPLLPDRLVVATDQGIFTTMISGEAFR